MPMFQNTYLSWERKNNDTESIRTCIDGGCFFAVDESYFSLEAIR